MLRRAGLNREDVREDIGEFSTISILTAYDLLLLLVVIAASEKMTKDHLRYVDLLSRMLLNGDTIAIILYRNSYNTCIHLSAHINVLDRSLSSLSTPNESIPSIYDNLIKEFVETRIERTRAIDHLSLGCIKDPSALIVCIS